MSLTLVTNPVGSADAKTFAGFKPIEFVFKREDQAITSVTSGVGGAKITLTADLTTYLSIGDTIYLYSPATNHNYDGVVTITDINATEITIDTPYLETGTGGYINYYKNYYVELQCVNIENTDINLLDFSLEADGDNAGNITIDVSIINDLNSQRGAIDQAYVSDSSTFFYVKYRQVYNGSSESFTILSSKMLIVLYATEQPTEEEILNSFDLPKIYLGYPASFAIAHATGATGQTNELLYEERDINGNALANDTLGTLSTVNNGFYTWEWDKDATVENATKYIYFSFSTVGTYDFASPDFAYPDFLTQ